MFSPFGSVSSSTSQQASIQLFSCSSCSALFGIHSGIGSGRLIVTMSLQIELCSWISIICTSDPILPEISADLMISVLPIFVSGVS